VGLHTDFNYDYHVSFTQEELAKNEAFYNYTSYKPSPTAEREGVSYNNNGERYYVRSQETLPTGMKLNLRFEFEKTGQEKFGAGGIGRLYINDKKVGETDFPRTVT
jgi:predicted dithiol-disulfide oxidoreductase (DUF899 family)